MINAQVLIDRIKTVSNYTNVDWMQEFGEDLYEQTELPAIRVSYHSLKTLPADQTEVALGMALNIYNENLQQYFVIQTVCEQKNFHTVWNKIWRKDLTGAIKLVGWNPVDDNSYDHSPLNLISTTTIGLSQGLIKSQDICVVSLPILNVN